MRIGSLQRKVTLAAAVVAVGVAVYFIAGVPARTTVARPLFEPRPSPTLSVRVRVDAPTRMPAESPSGSSASSPPTALDEAMITWMLSALEPRVADPMGFLNDMANVIRKGREEFLAMPDDPAWSRPTEQALRDFFRTHITDSLQISSVTCRNNGCIVLAEHFAPQELLRQQTPGMPHPTAEMRPLGPSLRLDSTMRAPLGDRLGMFLSYRRDPQVD